MSDFAALSDEDLMEAYYAEDDDARADRAFAELDRRYRTPMLLSVTAPGYNPRFVKLYKTSALDQKAEELVSEALFKAADTKGRPSARWDRRRKPLAPWLYGILHNVVVSYLRRKRRPVRSDADLQPPEEGQASPLEAATDPSPGPEEALQRRLLLEAVQECRRELPDELQRLCELLFDRGLKQTEIASMMKLTTPTLTRRKQEACERLRRCLRRRGFSPELFA
jgi:RNA polymerase sigma-70 factor (ECF subfamily)